MLSVVRKIVTDYRTEMYPSTLCALISCKLNSDSKCFELATPNELLRQAKTAIMECNIAHGSKFNDQSLCFVVFIIAFVEFITESLFKICHTKSVSMHELCINVVTVFLYIEEVISANSGDCCELVIAYLKK